MVSTGNSGNESRYAASCFRNIVVTLPPWLLQPAVSDFGFLDARLKAAENSSGVMLPRKLLWADLHPGDLVAVNTFLVGSLKVLAECVSNQPSTTTTAWHNAADARPNVAALSSASYLIRIERRSAYPVQKLPD